MSSCPFSTFVSKKERIEEDKPALIPDYDESTFLRVRRLHPTQGAKIVPANSHLRGPDGQCETETEIRKGAISRCGPYVHVNQMGWWLFPAVDIDITYHGNNNWEVHELTKFDGDAETEFLNSLPPYRYTTESGEEKTMEHAHRAHVNAGLADHNIIQVWTGCIFRTPPGWCLHIRSPINACEDYNRPFTIQEGIIESDWMDYDIWTNIVVNRTHEKISLRRDMWPPLAQIIPVRREAYEGKWDLDDAVISPDDPEWASWQDYNFKKWTQENEKEGRTYFRERTVQKPHPESKKPLVMKVRDKYREMRNNLQTRKDQKPK